MAEFLTTIGTSYHIEKLIIEAKTKLVLVSPYLKISKTFLERLTDAANRGVSIIVIYGKDELSNEEREKLAKLRSLTVYYSKNLHAKCYYNDASMVMSSMNMYEFSERNNREMGILINRSSDGSLYDSAVSEVHSIQHASELVRLTKQYSTIDFRNAPYSKSAFRSGMIKAHCIRCASQVAYNPARPYCTDCYSAWAKAENFDQVENVCHRCGERNPSTLNRPLDNVCHKGWQAEVSEGRWIEAQKR